MCCGISSYTATSLPKTQLKMPLLSYLILCEQEARPMTRNEKQWLSDVASLGCIACRNQGMGMSPADIHHVRTGQGMAQRAAHLSVLPLCPRLTGHVIPRVFMLIRKVGRQPTGQKLNY
ncbi:hypothetical protein XBJ1_2905 [Xenorhabdus bovienii SS-2004]|uniref:Uncharacterized protein n=1 Tax=Xenorhabdus bovienii (strain SS-2004) TaxID=406818 RepID=D3V867_XENBS|nr:hypothetical protein XBJ1_2905 [Xenorhabdus bovienii SS-2004]